MKNKMSFVSGMILGAVLLSGSMAFASDSLEVLPSADNIYLNGEHVSIKGYIVNGHNYMRLKDLSALLGFDLQWDNDTKQVHMYTEDADPSVRPELPEAAEKAVIPADGSRYVPRVGDVIRCDDGTDYKVTDVSRFDSNVFAEGPVGELPAATSDWSGFPDVELPRAEAKRIKDGDRDVLFVRNLYETRRMQYTVYNALAGEPDAWKGNSPLASVSLTIPADLDAYAESFWPWRASELTDLVAGRPNSRYYLEAWDYYLNGVYQYTRYQVVSM